METICNSHNFRSDVLFNSFLKCKQWRNTEEWTLLFGTPDCNLEVIVSSKTSNSEARFTQINPLIISSINLSIFQNDFKYEQFAVISFLNRNKYQAQHIILHRPTKKRGYFPQFQTSGKRQSYNINEHVTIVISHILKQ